MKKPARRALGGVLVRALAALVVLPVLALAVAAALTPLPAELRSGGHYSESVRYLDRDGALLREVRADDAARARWASLEEMGDVAAEAVVAAEDRRFFLHPGVDPWSVVRAVGSSLLHGRVVSGASTLTMQLARLVRPHPRNLRGKLGEMALAVRIEASLSKREILEQYMNRAPFGQSLRGIDAASRFYFDKPPSELSLAEAAALAAIPRGPAVYSMKKHPERVVRRRDRIIRRMLDAGRIGGDEAARATVEPLAVQAAKGSFGAPHLVQAIHDGALGARPRERRTTVVTTIARELQREAEAAAAAALKPLAAKHVTAASVVVLDNATGEIQAYVGSPDFQDASRGGQNDGVRAKRQPGSTLKPFVYGLAMERLGWTPATLVPDVELHLPVAGGVYAPLNYDERFHGPVRLRDALANSLNIPAVWTADAVGIPALLERLRAAGMTSLGEAAEFYGPALALGDGEVSLLELATAYATIARGGAFLPARAVRDLASSPEPLPEPREVMPRDVARALTDVLADKNARLAAFGERSVLELPFAVAAKTGTSKGFRDNWTVGFTREVTVAVWVGNFDGTPMLGVSGITGAAPLFRAVMEAAMRGRDAAPLEGLAGAEDWVEVDVCPLSGARPTRACPHAIREWVPRARRPELSACAMHEQVRIDRRNGLQAGEGCPQRFVEERSFERFDGQYAAWAASARRERAPDAFSPLCPGRGPSARPERGGSLRVAYPLDGARFLIDPERPRAQQTIAVRVEAARGTDRVSLRIDGRIVGVVDAPYVFRWALTPGEHVFSAEAAGAAASDTVAIRVD